MGKKVVRPATATAYQVSDIWRSHAKWNSRWAAHAQKTTKANSKGVEAGGAEVAKLTFDQSKAKAKPGLA